VTCEQASSQVMNTFVATASIVGACTYIVIRCVRLYIYKIKNMPENILKLDVT
jgi:hypothetical protein